MAQKKEPNPAKKIEPNPQLSVNPPVEAPLTTTSQVDPTRPPAEEAKTIPAAQTPPQAAMNEVAKLYDEMRAKNKNSFYKNRAPQLNNDGSVTLWFKDDKDADSFYTNMMKERKNFTVRDKDGVILYQAKDGVLQKRQGWLNPELKDFVKDEEVMKLAAKDKGTYVMTPPVANPHKKFGDDSIKLHGKIQATESLTRALEVKKEELAKLGNPASAKPSETVETLKKEINALEKEVVKLKGEISTETARLNGEAKKLNIKEGFNKHQQDWREIGEQEDEVKKLEERSHNKDFSAEDQKKLDELKTTIASRKEELKAEAVRLHEEAETLAGRGMKLAEDYTKLNQKTEATEAQKKTLAEIEVELEAIDHNQHPDDHKAAKDRVDALRNETEKLDREIKTERARLDGAAEKLAVAVEKTPELKAGDMQELTASDTTPTDDTADKSAKGQDEVMNKYDALVKDDDANEVKHLGDMNLQEPEEMNAPTPGGRH